MHKKARKLFGEDNQTKDMDYWNHDGSSYSCLCIISIQSADSPLASDINKVFCPHNNASLDILSFSDHSL